MQRELVEQAMGGDIDAYSELVRASHRRLFGIASLILRDSDLTQDAVPQLAAAEPVESATNRGETTRADMLRVSLAVAYGPAGTSPVGQPGETSVRRLVNE